MTHVEGDVNPVRDLEIIYEELRLKDEEQLMKNLDKLERTVGRGADKKMKPEYVSCMNFSKNIAKIFISSMLQTFSRNTQLIYEYTHKYYYE